VLAFKQHHTAFFRSTSLANATTSIKILSLSQRYCRQVLDETLRCAVVAPWGARVQMDHDLQIGEYVVPKEVYF